MLSPLVTIGALRKLDRQVDELILGIGPEDLAGTAHELQTCCTQRSRLSLEGAKPHQMPAN